jgi:insulysin
LSRDLQSDILEVSKNDPRSYRYLVLPNGLRVILVSDPKADKAAAALSVSVGSFSDPEEIPGLAHFLEHMLFLGSEKYPGENDYSEYLSENGGYSNAYTAAGW